MLRKKGTDAAGKRAQRRAAAEDAAAVKAVLDAKAARGAAEVDENEAGRSLVHLPRKWRKNEAPEAKAGGSTASNTDLRRSEISQ
jgi:high-affinity K+ transport system ATPase subunit B